MLGRIRSDNDQQGGTGGDTRARKQKAGISRAKKNVQKMTSQAMRRAYDEQRRREVSRVLRNVNKICTLMNPMNPFDL